MSNYSRAKEAKQVSEKPGNNPDGSYSEEKWIECWRNKDRFTRNVLAKLQEYIEEAEHMDGQGFWTGYGDDDYLPDFARYIAPDEPSYKNKRYKLMCETCNTPLADNESYDWRVELSKSVGRGIWVFIDNVIDFSGMQCECDEDVEPNWKAYEQE